MVLGAMQTQTIPVSPKCCYSPTEVMYMLQSSLSEVQPRHVVVLILVQATGGEMEVLQKLFQYFLSDLSCRSLKTLKREMISVDSGRASRTRRRWSSLGEQGRSLTQRSASGLGRVFESEQGVGMLNYYLYMRCFLISTLRGLAF